MRGFTAGTYLFSKVMSGLADISVVNQLAVCWAAGAAGAVFLAVSAWHNGRSAHQVRPEPRGVADVLGWLDEVEAFLSADHGGRTPAAESSLSSSNGIFPLAEALQRNKGAVPSAVEAPLRDPVRA